MKKAWYEINNNLYHNVHNFDPQAREIARIKIWDKIYFELVHIKKNIQVEAMKKIE